VPAPLSYLGLVPLGRGDHTQAARYFEESLEISREIGDRLVASQTLYNLALEESRSGGDHERAAQLYVEGTRLAAEMGDKANAAHCLEGLAGLIAERGESARAARLFGASEALLEAAGAPRYVQVQARALYERAVDALRSRLGEEAFGVAWAEGKAMPLEQAVEYALSAEEEPTEAPAPEESPDIGEQLPAALTRREREVAMLVAQELTNRRIAEELVISERTVATHVHKILQKLNLRSRLQIAAWAMEQDLLQ
jgi:DNA-binding CsgD family transcriptional regulator